ncbi:MAG: fasciclin [Opitutus sp.]|nr:fasciclin [Opitutus sp.]
MKNTRLLLTLPCAALLALLFAACSKQQPAAPAETAAAPGAGQSAVADDESQKDIVKVAAGSKAHTTLVTAVKAAELVDVLTNTGPFTVFAPTNEAFQKLPAGTVDNLLKPQNKDALADILQYHVAVAVFKPEMLKDGMTLNMANGGNVKIAIKDGKIILNGAATVLGTAPASNGIVHVIDGVLLPPSGK